MITIQKAALKAVSRFAPKNDIRYYLRGVYVQATATETRLVATDGHTMLIHRSQCENTHAWDGIIPLDTVTAILKHKSPYEKKNNHLPIELSECGGTEGRIDYAGQAFVFKPVDGKFPDYRQIIPKDATTKALLSVRELTTAVKRMHYFAKEVNNNLTFTLRGNEAQIATPQTQLGKDETTIVTEVVGTEGKIALSSSYLLDFLSHINSEHVELRITDSMHPAVFYIPGNDRFLHLIMPLRLQES